MDNQAEHILKMGFIFADLSGEPDLPPEACRECAQFGFRHACGTLAFWCKHTGAGGVRVPPGAWRFVGPVDAAVFFGEIFSAPVRAAEKIRGGETLQ